MTLVLTGTGLVLLITIGLQNIQLALNPDPQTSQWSGLIFVLMAIIAAPVMLLGGLFTAVSLSLYASTTVPPKEKSLIRMSMIILATLAVMAVSLLVAPVFLVTK